MKRIYLVLAVLGAVVPYTQVIPFVMEHGLDFPLIVQQMFANRIAAAFSLDILLSVVVVAILTLTEGRARRVPHLWLPLAATVVFGVSCGLPAYLFLRESARRSV